MPWNTTYILPLDQLEICESSGESCFQLAAAPPAMPEASRLTDAEAADWLVRHGFDPPADVAGLCKGALFIPGQAGTETEPHVVQNTARDDGWFLLYRDSTSVRLGQEADSGIPYSEEWHVFDFVEDLLSSEIPHLLNAMATEFQGAVVDDGSIRGLLYEFDAKQEVECAKDTARYLRVRRSWEKLRADYEGGEEWSLVKEPYWKLHKAAHEFAQVLRDIRGRPQPVSGVTSIAAEPAPVAPSFPSLHGLVVDLSPPQVTLRGKPYSVSADGALMVKTLLDADGDWVAGDTLNMRADRVKKSLPSPVQDLIESVPGKGNRIPRTALAELRQVVEQPRRK